jgi:DASH complex subunit DAD3
VLEKKMGLVLTLVMLLITMFPSMCADQYPQFKASVWGVINEQAMPDTSDLSYEYEKSDNTIRI